MNECSLYGMCFEWMSEPDGKAAGEPCIQADRRWDCGYVSPFSLWPPTPFFCFPRKTETLLPSQLRGAGLLSAKTIIGVYGQESGMAAF